ncbi:MAG: hypothetical protein ACK5YW_08460 [Betaproteobacteria bacterium]|jgi:hypothetical protein|nr:hypothetical protein [Rhodocyclaceae bacterium]MCA3133497.1 hypothetical protein [Rhodocyclaceae bacterium]MCA3141431.1 hypothetical protein [Rhodocyclaceae bacterium]MCA3145762.1 hypothetical protein [Rhodocyclaceae bacterium]MCE2897968.1 hypothetical protein [Betaproteobacteria bacterium]
MKTYPADSPEAMARVLAMVMLADARLDDRELQALERLDLLRLIGLTREQFSQVVKDYCDELLAAGAAGGKINLMDKARIDTIVDGVQDERKRTDAASMALILMKADQQFHDAELALLRYTLGRWGLSLDELQRSLAG